MNRPIFLAILLFCLLCGLIGTGGLFGQGQPASLPSAASDNQALFREYQEKTTSLGGQRSFDQGVLTIRLPRTDLWVQADMGEIPTAAGLESRFYFYRCICGKDKVAGEFALADYEVNDVIDALRAGHMEVVSVAGMFVGDKPRMMSLRFQGEGNAVDLTKTLAAALSWVGDARSARQTTQPADQMNP
jgi:Domain of Unknown Function (DUF1259)